MDLKKRATWSAAFLLTIVGVAFWAVRFRPVQDAPPERATVAERSPVPPGKGDSFSPSPDFDPEPPKTTFDESGGSMRELSALLAERHDLSNPAVREAYLRRVKVAEGARMVALEEKARRMHLEMEGDLPDGGRFALVDFEGDRPVYERTRNVNAAISIATDQVRSVVPFNVDGSGMTMGLWEAGGIPLATHQEFGSPSRVTNMQGSGSSSHATHVAGTMIAAGVLPSIKGMAPGARIRAYNSTSDATEMLGEGAATAGEAGKILISNHSYGFIRGWEEESTGWVWYGAYSEDSSTANDVETRFGKYTSDSVAIDGMAYNLPYYLPFFSAGNNSNDGPPAVGETWRWGSTTGPIRTYDPALHPRGDGAYKWGYDTIDGKGLAKNVMTVGAVEDAVSGGTRSLPAAVLAAFSSVGPADDGRIKPDIVTNGSSVTSSTNASITATGSSSGTSMASPGAAGSALLLQQYYSNRFPGGAMRASTLKGLMIHTADDLGNPGPDYRYGWGLMNTRAAAELITMHADGGRGSISESEVSNAVKTITRTFKSDGVTPLRFTICWTDPAGFAASGSHDARSLALMNNLNLTVTGPGGTVHKPYVMPYVNANTITQASLSAHATTGDNYVDNVEQVYLAAPPVAGDYIVTVNCGSFYSSPQKFSLIASGFSLAGMTGIEAWRQQHFGTTSGTGDAANLFDKDSDGLVNLIEYAFGLDPKNGASNGLPQGQRVGLNYVVSFPTPPGVDGVTYAAEWSPSLASGSWQPVTDTGTGTNHTFSVPVSGATRKFIRLKVIHQ